MKRYALGVHHLNIAYNAGSEATYHRQVREGIIPLLDLLSRHPSWCFTIEMSGFSVEFIAQRYPSVLQRIRDMIHQGQIEFISCTYAPSIWIAFPKSDMIRSIELNRQLLDEYGIPATRIFFSQENFSGEGIQKLSKWFDVAVIKDDYYFYLHDIPANQDIKPYYMLGDLKLVIGWNHILDSVLPELVGSDRKRSDRANFIYHQHKKFIDDSSKKSREHKLTGYVAAHESSLEWTWYHIGSSERFAKPYMRPDNIARCRLTPEWFFYLEDHLASYESEGFCLSGIQQFLDQVTLTSFTPSPSLPLLDGAWNMEQSNGCFNWMGFNSNAHEDDLAVRNHNWRSRAQLLAAETLCSLNIVPAVHLNELKKAWKHQLLSEVSDATGWYADKTEVAFSIMHSENVYNIVSQIANTIKLKIQVR